MWNVNTFCTYKLNFFKSITVLIFLSGCGDNESKTSVPEPPIVEASPLETETPGTENPTSLFKCVGENFDNSGDKEQVSEFDQELDIANWLYEGKTTILSRDKQELISSISKNEDLITLSLRSKEDINLLFSIQQEPFHGFLQAGIRQAQRGGWAQCQGSQQSLKKLAARPLKCFAVWTTPNGGTGHFAFPMEEASSRWQPAFETTSFQLKYRSTEHFILYKIVEPNGEIEMATAMTDRYFVSSRAVFNFNPLFVSIDCKSEDL